MIWPFDNLVEHSYDVIVADPPWPFDLYSNKGNHKSAAHHYQTLLMEDIAALPVGRLAQRDTLLLLWVTAPQLERTLGVLTGWGFTYKTNLVWIKTTKNGLPRMGTGYWARTMHEQVLIGTIGRPRPQKAFPSAFLGEAREHSRKPDEFYELVRKHAGGIRRCELFSREHRDGFVAWGDEAGKFNSAPVTHGVSQQGDRAMGP